MTRVELCKLLAVGGAVLIMTRPRQDYAQHADETRTPMYLQNLRQKRQVHVAHADGVRVLPFTSTSGGHHYPIQAAGNDISRLGASSDSLPHPQQPQTTRPVVFPPSLPPLSMGPSPGQLPTAPAAGQRLSQSGTAPSSIHDQSCSLGRIPSNDSSSSWPPGSSASIPISKPSPTHGDGITHTAAAASPLGQHMSQGSSGAPVQGSQHYPLGDRDDSLGGGGVTTNEDREETEIPVSFNASPLSASPEKRSDFELAMAKSTQLLQSAEQQLHNAQALTGANHALSQKREVPIPSPRKREE